MQIAVDDIGTPNAITHPIPGAAQCANVQLLGDWSVDRYGGTGKPAWIELTTPVTPPLTGAGGQFTITPTNTEIGTYAVRVKYYSPVNSGSQEATFVLDIYPATAYSITAPTMSCVTDIFPLTLGNYQDISVLDGDFDGTDYIICGGTKSAKNARTLTYESAYVQSLNKNIMVNY